MNRSTKSTTTQRGTIIVVATAGLLLLLAASAMSVDAGYFFAVRNELQNAVDAAVLAGAQGLIADPGNTTYNGRATQLAMQVAAKNEAADAPVILSPGEVTFPNSTTIRIGITRPVRTFFATVFGVSQVNAQVRAAAAVVPVNGISGGVGGGGMRPFAILDQFGHGSLCVPPNDADVNDPPHGPFNPAPHEWMGFTAVDHYTSPYDPAFESTDLSREFDCSTVTGFISPRDITGRLVRLKHGSGDWVTPGNFGPAALGAFGAGSYEYNIAHGYDGIVQVGDILDTEPGNMAGPTHSGMDALIDQDPSAQLVRTASGWAVISDDYPMNESPRIVPVPMYSVNFPPANGRSEFRVDNISSFFVVNARGQEVFGYFVQSRAKTSKPASPAGATVAAGRFLATVQMIDTDQIQ